MKKALIPLLVLYLQLPLWHTLQAQEGGILSDSAFASLITCGPGNEFYLSWGHTALRICDSVRGIDIAYNYGTFDFDTPHFYWKFACGDLDYCLSRHPFGSFMEEYLWEGRAVWEQRLQLSPQEVKNLYLMMEQNYLPEYRYYKYDFFRDNCATRVRDMIAGCLNHRTLSPECTADTALSFRQHVYRASERTELWWRLGVDIALGMRCDRRCSNYGYMFSPMEMMAQFDTLTVSDTGAPLAAPAERLLNDVRTPMSKSLPPTWVFWALAALAIVLTVMERRKGWHLTAMDKTLFAVVTIVSALVIFLWFFTTHWCTKGNLNILWASPLFLYFTLRNKRWTAAAPTLDRVLIWLQMAMLLVAIVLCFVPRPQHLNAAICPICLILAIRLIASSTLKDR